MINAEEFETEWKELRKHVRPRWQAITDAEVSRFLHDFHAVRAG